MLRLRARAEAFRGSLFYVPTLFVLAAIALAQGSLALDRWITDRGFEVPTLLSSTVNGARALLGTVAAATITFAGIAFSVALLTIQLASSQFSPRVLHGFFRDSFSKRVIGFALATFTFSLVVLRGVRDPTEAGEAVIPHVSVFAGVLLGVVAILAVVGFINHSAHSMEVGEIIRRIADEARANIRRMCPFAAGTSPKMPVEGPMPTDSSFIVRSASDGWVQEVDVGRLLRLVPAGGVVRLETSVGRFITEGSPLCKIWPAPEDEERATRAGNDAVRLGRRRTATQDISLGFRQLVDIALHALSPGINDPTTAREAIEHIGAVLRELMLRDLPPRVIADEEERRAFHPEARDHRDYVERAFAEIRMAAASQPAVCITLLNVQGMLVRELRDRGLTERGAIVAEQAEHVVEACRTQRMLDHDLDEVRRVAKEHELLVE